MDTLQNQPYQPNRYYYKKEYKKALVKYEEAFKNHPKRIEENHRFNIACFYALTGDSDNAFKYLNMLMDGKEKWKMKIIEEADLNSLHNDKRWKALIQQEKKQSEYS